MINKKDVKKSERSGKHSALSIVPQQTPNECQEGREYDKSLVKAGATPTFRMLPRSSMKRVALIGRSHCVFASAACFRGRVKLRQPTLQLNMRNTSPYLYACIIPLHSSMNPLYLYACIVPLHAECVVVMPPYTPCPCVLHVARTEVCPSCQELTRKSQQRLTLHPNQLWQA